MIWMTLIVHALLISMMLTSRLLDSSTGNKPITYFKGVSVLAFHDLIKKTIVDIFRPFAFFFLSHCLSFLALSISPFFRCSQSLDRRKTSSSISQSLPIGRKSQDAAVGVLVQMLKTAPPLRQDSSTYMVSSMSGVQRQGSSVSGTESEFSMARTTSDALEELRNYKQLKDLLLSKSKSVGGATRVHWPKTKRAIKLWVNSLMIVCKYGFDDYYFSSRFSFCKRRVCKITYLWSFNMYISTNKVWNLFVSILLNLYKVEEHRSIFVHVTNEEVWCNKCILILVHFYAYAYKNYSSNFSL